ncbi:MAG TPA: Ku protein [Firmicutes bacterium]|nr:Ku protein [Bacillota bacterium]
MRTLWKGAISFGLVNVPVGLYTATEKKEVKFNYLHEKCKTPIQYEKHCPTCNLEVPPEEIVRGYEFQKGQYVILKEEDFERLPDGNTKTIDIVDFVDLEEIDPIYFEKSYFLEPSRGGEKAYALLKKAMLETGKIAIAKVTIRSKESLAVLRVAQNVLMMETIFYPDEIRSPATLNGVQNEPSLHENEVKMATNLIANLSSHFEPVKYTNRYREDLLKLIEAKITGGEVAQTPERESGKIIDLMEALRASIAATEKNEEPSQVGEKPRRRTKTS